MKHLYQIWLILVCVGTHDFMISKMFIAVLLLSVVQVDQWKRIIVDSGKPYRVKDEAKLYMPLYLQNEGTIHSDVLINNDTSKVIKMSLLNPFPTGDTLKIELFDNDVSYSHSFNIVILKDQFTIRYRREIIGTDLTQKFDPIRTKLELNSMDFSNGSKIRGHVEYIGKCLSGCTGNTNKVEIKGNFAVKIYRY